MPAEVETMFYTKRETPWHGLGTPVECALNSKEALEMAGLNWQVNKQKIYTGDPSYEVENYFANVRDTDGKVLGVVTDRYKIIQNNEAFDFTDSLIGEGVSYETAGSLMGGKKIWLLAKMPTTEIVGDAVDPYICFTNSHDGKGAIQVCMTPVRVVCNNTLNLALSTANRKWSTKHTGDIQSKLEEAKYTLGMANHYMEELAVTADVLANTTVSDDQVKKIIDEMFPVDKADSDRKKNNVQKAKEEYWIAYYMPDIKQFRNTAWGMVNAMSDMATHSTPQRQTQSFAENNWNRVIDGHAMIDMAVDKVMALV